MNAEFRVGEKIQVSEYADFRRYNVYPFIAKYDGKYIVRISHDCRAFDFARAVPVQPEFVQWSSSKDVPLDAWYSIIEGDGDVHRLTGLHSDKIFIDTHGWFSFERALSMLRYTLDPTSEQIAWYKCGKVKQ